MHTCWLHTRHGESLSSDIERKMSGIEKRNASFAVFCQRNYNPTFYNTGDCNHLPDPEVGRQLPDFWKHSSGTRWSTSCQSPKRCFWDSSDFWRQASGSYQAWRQQERFARTVCLLDSWTSMNMFSCTGSACITQSSTKALSVSVRVQWL